MKYVVIESGFAHFRPPWSRSIRDTFETMPYSTAYGLLSNLLGKGQAGFDDGVEIAILQPTDYRPEFFTADIRLAKAKTTLSGEGFVPVPPENRNITKKQYLVGFQVILGVQGQDIERLLDEARKTNFTSPAPLGCVYVGDNSCPVTRLEIHDEPPMSDLVVLYPCPKNEARVILPVVQDYRNPSNAKTVGARWELFPATHGLVKVN